MKVEVDGKENCDYNWREWCIGKEFTKLLIKE